MQAVLKSGPELFIANATGRLDLVGITLDTVGPGGTQGCPGAKTLATCEDPAIPNTTCTKKRTLKICCRETALCKGAKLGEDGLRRRQ